MLSWLATENIMTLCKSKWNVCHINYVSVLALNPTQCNWLCETLFRMCHKRCIGVQEDGWKRETHLGRISCWMPTRTAEGGVRHDDSLWVTTVCENRDRVIKIVMLQADSIQTRRKIIVQPIYYNDSTLLLLLYYLLPYMYHNTIPFTLSAFHSATSSKASATWQPSSVSGVGSVSMVYRYQRLSGLLLATRWSQMSYACLSWGRRSH
jgi:hypothetical protein